MFEHVRRTHCAYPSRIYLTSTSFPIVCWIQRWHSVWNCRESIVETQREAVCAHEMGSTDCCYWTMAIMQERTHSRSCNSGDTKHGSTTYFLFLSIPSTVATATSRAVRHVTSAGAFRLRFQNSEKKEKSGIHFSIAGRFDRFYPLHDTNFSMNSFRVLTRGGKTVVTFKFNWSHFMSSSSPSIRPRTANFVAA